MRRTCSPRRDRRRATWSVAALSVALVLIPHLVASETLASPSAASGLQLRGTLTTPRPSSRSPLVAHGDLVFVGAGDRVLAIDVSDPASPRRIGESQTLTGGQDESGLLSGVQALALEGDRLLVTLPSALHVLDAEAPGRLQVLTSLHSGVDDPLLQGAERMDRFAGPALLHEGVVLAFGTAGIVYRGYGAWRLAALELGEDGDLVLSSLQRIGRGTGWGVADATTSGSDLWIALGTPGNMSDTGYGGLQRWDLAEPARPLRRLSMHTPLDPTSVTPPRWYRSNAIAMRDGSLALGTSEPQGMTFPDRPSDQDGRGGLRLLGVSGAGLVPSTSWRGDAGVADLAWRGGSLFLATLPSGAREPARILRLDLAEGPDPIPREELLWPSAIRTLAGEGARLYAMDEAGTLLVMHTSVAADERPWSRRALVPFTAGR